ncbi:MAG: methyltransferase domain-containing protein [Pseudomonadota bacterium]
MKLPGPNVPTLVDRESLARRRARRREDALFLHHAAVHEIKDRLSMVNRTFTDVAVVAPFADIWAQEFHDARLVGESEMLDLDPGSRDLIVHAMALHWANDPVGQIIQCRRALRPDGLFLGICPGGATLNELRKSLAQAETEETGGLSPRVAPMAEIRDLGALLQRAGFALPVADGFDLKVEYRDLWHLMRDLRGMGESNALAARLRQPTRRSVFRRADAIYRSGYGLSNGRLPATFELICLTGWAPADTQPKPLRPGAATTRLADALGTTEGKLSD